MRTPPPTTAAAGPSPDDAGYMRIALDQARAAAVAGEAPVGAVVVDMASGQVLAAAHNEPVGLTDPTAHAEILALRRAAAALGNYRLKPDLALYVTLEPCTMCAGAISHARIRRLVYGAHDPKGGGVAHGARFFGQPTCHWRPDVTAGCLEADCASLLREFFRARRGRTSKTA